MWCYAQGPHKHPRQAQHPPYIEDILLRLTLGCCCLPAQPRYDGQTWVKPPEVLTRDRLLGAYEVRPAMQKLRTSLLGSGGMLLLCAVLLFGLIRTGADADGFYGG